MFFLALKNKRKGFTLVEMMVAIAVFSIVMVVAMSALLNVIDANNKARSIKTAINNISFALEGISKDMRMGEDYACGNIPNEPSGDCDAGGGDIIKYRSPRAEYDPVLVDGKQVRRYVYYKFDGTQIWECMVSAIVPVCNEGDFSPITSEEVTINNATFYVLDTNSPSTIGDRKQPRMILTISGTAGPENKPQLQTTFDLQTTISQRARK